MTPEAKVKAKIKAILKQYDCVWWMPAAAYGRSGVSDFNVLYKGTFIAIEAKATVKNKPTALQKKYLDQIREAGGIGLVVTADNVNHLAYILFNTPWPEARDAVQVP
jgi:penicillin-binding protein-related factor A (putative recombinase)